MKELTLSFSVVWFAFALTFFLSSCDSCNKNNQLDTKCKIMMNMTMNWNSNSEYIYDEDIQGYVTHNAGDTSEIKLTYSFEGSDIYDTTMTDHGADIDTFYIVKINEKEIQTLMIMRDSVSLSGNVGDFDSLIMTNTYTKGSYKDFMNGETVTIYPTKESKELMDKYLLDVLTNTLGKQIESLFPKEIQDGKSSVDLKMEGDWSLHISKSEAKDQTKGSKFEILLGIPLTKEACDKARKNMK